MTTCVHNDESAPKRERWRVLRAVDDQEIGGRWITVKSFPTEREANAFAQGFILGSAYAPAPEPLGARENRALKMVKAARDEYKRECRELRAKLANTSMIERGDN